MQLLEETLAVLSFGKLCKEHGYTCEWPSSREPRLTRNGKHNFSRTENFVPLVVPGQSSSSTSVSFLTSLPQDAVAGNCNEGVPDWLEDFTENLDMAEVVPPAEISHDTDLELFFKVCITQAQYLQSLPGRPKLRGLQGNQDYEGSLQIANWKLGTSSTEIWWVNYS